MFDFAVTGRPMIFFTYDLEQYRDELRGFYFDFEAEAPGPLLATSDEVLAAIADLGTAGADQSAAYQAFVGQILPAGRWQGGRPRLRPALRRLGLRRLIPGGGRCH